MLTWFFAHLRIVYHKAFIFYTVIGLGEDMTPNGFKFTRSNGIRSQGSLKNVNMVFAHYLEYCLSQSFDISHANWSW